MWVRDRSLFPGRVNETNVLQIKNTKKHEKNGANDSDDGFRLSLSAAPIFRGNYMATVVIKLLKEAESVSVRARI